MYIYVGKYSDKRQREKKPWGRGCFILTYQPFRTCNFWHCPDMSLVHKMKTNVILLHKYLMNFRSRLFFFYHVYFYERVLGSKLIFSWLIFYKLKVDFHEANNSLRNRKEDIALVEIDITRSVMSISTNAMSAFGFRSELFASWKSTLK